MKLWVPPCMIIILIIPILVVLAHFFLLQLIQDNAPDETEELDEFGRVRTWGYVLSIFF